MLEATGDGIKSDNETDADRGYVLIENGTVNITSGDDGIKGFNDVAISGGAVTVSDSLKAIKTQTLVISGAASWFSDPPWGKRLGRRAVGVDHHRRRTLGNRGLRHGRVPLRELHPGIRVHEPERQLHR